MIPTRTGRLIVGCIASLAACVGTVGGVTGCSAAAGPVATDIVQSGPPSSSSSSEPPTGGTSVGITRIPSRDRQPVPRLAGPAIGPGGASTLDVAGFTGSVVIVNAWASWCPPCREEIPGIILTAGTLRSLGVVVLGLNVSDDLASAEAFIADSGMNYPSIVDAQGALLPTIPGVPPQALPSTIIIDREGRIAARIIGPTTGEELDRLTREIASEPAA